MTPEVYEAAGPMRKPLRLLLAEALRSLERGANKRRNTMAFMAGIVCFIDAFNFAGHLVAAVGFRLGW
jgi:hypothetical protein